MSHRVNESHTLLRNGPSVKIRKPISHGAMNRYPVMSFRMGFRKLLRFRSCSRCFAVRAFRV